MQWRDALVQGRGLRLYVRRVVGPPASPVLLLHGLGVGGSIWQAFARRLLPHLAAIAPDLRGHGQSDAPPAGFLPGDYADDLVPLIDAEHKPVPVIGHSLGALVALQLAAREPTNVPWVVLLDPPVDAKLRNVEVENVARLRHAAPGELEAYLLERNPGGGQLLAQTLARLFRQASDETFEAMLGGRRGTIDEADQTAASVTQPVLVLQADPTCGGVLGDAAARAFVERFARGELQKVEGATHALHASQPAEVARRILSFAGY